METFKFHLLSPKEVKYFLEKLDPKKATGHDGIPARVLRGCSEVLALPLSLLFNSIITSGHFPNDWKLAEVCPVFKKDDPLNKCNYRPVSILTTLENVLEKCQNYQLVEYFSPFLSPFLSAYCKGYSCEAVLLRLVESWKQHLDNRQIVGSVMLDLSKAFDLIPHNLLLDKLATYGISTQSLYLIKNYLCGRRQCVKIAGAKSDTINISRGVPQGSVLGPLFFNIFLNDLFYFVSVAELTNYADGNQISFSHQDPVEVQSVLINELDTASKWFKDCGMTLNLDKCKLFVLPESKSSDIKICIDDINVDAIDKVELLGVIIDNKLHFKDHISKIAKKVGKQLISLIVVLCGITALKLIMIN